MRDSPNERDLPGQYSFWTCLLGLPVGLVAIVLLIAFARWLNQGGGLLLLIGPAIFMTVWAVVVYKGEQKDIAGGNDWVARHIKYSRKLFLGTVCLWFGLLCLGFLTLLQVLGVKR